MSAVNQARSVSDTDFSAAIPLYSYDKPGWPGYRDLGFRDGDLGNRNKTFPI